MHIFAIVLDKCFINIRKELNIIGKLDLNINNRNCQVNYIKCLVVYNKILHSNLSF